MTMVENNPVASKQLQRHCELLSNSHCHIETTSAQQFLIGNTQQFDILFIDPPYQLNLWTEIANLLVEQATLADHAHIYLECPSKGPLPSLPEQWQLIKDKKAGNVRYCLFKANLGDEA